MTTVVTARARKPRVKAPTPVDPTSSIVVHAVGASALAAADDDMPENDLTLHLAGPESGFPGLLQCRVDVRTSSIALQRPIGRRRAKGGELAQDRRPDNGSSLSPPLRLLTGRTGREPANSETGKMCIKH